MMRPGNYRAKRQVCVQNSVGAFALFFFSLLREAGGFAPVMPESLREFTIETPDPGVLFLDLQDRMTLVNWTLELRFALRYLHLTFPFSLHK